MNRKAIIKFSPVQQGLHGNVTIHCFRHGLLCKSAALTAQEQDVTDEGIFAAGVRLIITLQGRSELCFGQQNLLLNAEKRATAALLSISKPVYGIKKFVPYQAQRELVIFLEPEWIQHSYFSRLADSQSFITLQQMHLQSIPLFVNKRILTLAGALAQDVAPDTLVVTHLRKESECLLLIAELLAQLPHLTRPMGLSVELRRINQLTQMLQNGELDNWNLLQIAHKMHTNVTSLQNQFKQVHGVSIMAYLRQVKLERAYKALLQGATVNQAADIAGYANPDNFTTAFRRYFDIVPSKVKKSRLTTFIG
ncbi:AraC family transcriptional regulator [Pasteurellaceae bacterium LIM206]|nr:AraC family transcriptional regulator [Pasteurellaceae bacterium LIM206]